VPIDLPTYRDRLEQMTAEALEEYYNHSAGLKPTMEMARIYERYADMTTLAAAQELNEMDAPAELRRFAARFGSEALLDRESRAYRDAGLMYLRMDAGEILERLLRDPRLLRLPLARAGDRLSVGPDEAAWTDWLRT